MVCELMIGTCTNEMNVLLNKHMEPFYQELSDRLHFGADGVISELSLKQVVGLLNILKW